MKVCIVTLFKTFNSGSYLQAKALGTVISDMGHEVCYYNVRYMLSRKLDNFKKLFSTAASSGLASARKYCETLFGFPAAQRKLPVISARDIDSVDVFVLGSDTIWNLDSPNSEKFISQYWGSLYGGKPIVTYAGSAGNTKKEKFDLHPELAREVSRWKAISVRDEHTARLIASLTDKPVTTVCDPTLLLSRQYYEQAVSPAEGSFIFLYLFTDLSDAQRKELYSLAERENLKIVKGTYIRSRTRTDIQLGNTPEQFLRYMLAARYIITDTFHGSVFSVNLQKQFVAVDRGKQKVNDFLARSGFGERLLKNGASLLSLFDSTIDYTDRMGPIEDMRRSSIDFLRSALDE